MRHGRLEARIFHDPAIEKAEARAANEQLRAFIQNAVTARSAPPKAKRK